MGNTRDGGLKTVATNKLRYGDDFYAKIGAKGGRKGTTGGFYADPELAREAGRRGGYATLRYPGARRKGHTFVEKTEEGLLVFRNKSSGELVYVLGNTTI